MPVLMYGSVTIWKERERSRIRAVQLDNLRGMQCIRRMARVPNPRIREKCGILKVVDERIVVA